MFFIPEYGSLEYLITFMSLAAGCAVFYDEIRGKNCPYSKFEKECKEAPSFLKVPSRVGMFIIYAPAFIVITIWAYKYSTITSNPSTREFVLIVALSFHFLKRLLEVAFLHRYSGMIDITTSAMISIFGYVQMSIVRLYYQQKVPIDFYDHNQHIYILGICLFLVGQAGNFYHHYLQTTWKRGKHNQYVVPHGGLFALVACPHYLFEIMIFWGLNFISQDILSVFGTFAVMGNLFGRSIATSRYYRSKMKNYPIHRYHIVPMLF